jgi:hypothetical protein
MPAGARPTSGRRVLVIANDAVGGDRLVEEITRRIGDPHDAEVRIVSPPLVDRAIDLLAGEVDEDIEEARRRLRVSVEALQMKGIEASGDVGDADPVLAIKDALALFPADEVIIIAHPPEHASWLERNVLDRARSELSIPITYVQVEHVDATGPAVEKVEQVRPTPEGSPQRRGETKVDYLPEATRRDRLALLVGVVGTIALGVALLVTGDVSTVTILLAIGAFMVTVWHVAALLIMRGSGYRGLWATLAADTILYGIPPAVVLGVLFA